MLGRIFADVWAKCKFYHAHCSYALSIVAVCYHRGMNQPNVRITLVSTLTIRVSFLVPSVFYILSTSTNVRFSSWSRPLIIAVVVHCIIFWLWARATGPIGKHGCNLVQSRMTAIKTQLNRFMCVTCANHFALVYGNEFCSLDGILELAAVPPPTAARCEANPCRT